MQRWVVDINGKACLDRARPPGVSTTPQACAHRKTPFKQLKKKQRRVTYLLFRMLSWRMFDVEGFIEAVKVRPALYNSKHPNFNRKDIRARMWDEIGRIMYPDWDNLEEQDKNEKGSLMQKKWKSLKDCFNREIRLQKIQDPNKVRKKYEFYDRLCFLLNKNNSETPKTYDDDKNIKFKLEDFVPETTDKTQSFSDLFPAQNQSLEGGQNKRNDFSMGFKVKKFRRVSAESENSDKLFLMSFMNDFKRLPLTTKYWVKMKFSEVMHQAAMSLDESLETDFEQDVCSPVNGYSPEFSALGNSPDSSSSEIYDVCHH